MFLTRPKFLFTSLPLLLFAVAGSAAAVSYTVTDLATLAEGTTMVIRGPNSDGVASGGGKVVGANRSIASQKGLLMAPGQLSRIDGFVGSDYTNVMSVNKAGTFVGGANTTTGIRAFRGTRDGTIASLPQLAGDSASVAYAINDQGRAAGYSSGPAGERAVVWERNNTVIPLQGIASTSSRALGINDRGDVVGTVDTAAGRRAAFWSGETTGTELAMLGGHITSEAYSVNARGDTVGFSGTTEGVRHATLWQTGGGTVNLGTLTDGLFSEAFGNNDRGQIVGSSTSSKGNRAVIWLNSGPPQDLNSMLSAPGLVVTKAVGINNNGTIIAVGRTVMPGDENHDSHDHEQPARVLLLTPTGGLK